MSDQKSSSGRFPRRTPGPWPGREAGAARRRKSALIPGKGRNLLLAAQLKDSLAPQRKNYAGPRFVIRQNDDHLLVV
jgi:hypothetical protein